MLSEWKNERILCSEYYIISMNKVLSNAEEGMVGFCLREEVSLLRRGSNLSTLGPSMSFIIPYS